MSLDAQAKVLRALETGVVTRVGGSKPIEVDVRVVAATNKDLEKEIKRGNFPEDLFFRRAGLTLAVPPLRERKEEIEPLALRFLHEWSQHLGRTSAPLLDPEALELLLAHRWPGNIRELKNAMERAVTLSDGDRVLPAHLPDRIRSGDATAGAQFLDEKDRLLGEIDDLERKRTLDALGQCGGNQTRAAQLLGISRRTLLNRLDAYQVQRPRKKP